MFEKQDEISFGMGCTGSGCSGYNDISAFVTKGSFFNSRINRNFLKISCRSKFYFKFYVDRLTPKQMWRGGGF